MTEEAWRLKARFDEDMAWTDWSRGKADLLALGSVNTAHPQSSPDFSLSSEQNNLWNDGHFLRDISVVLRLRGEKNW